ncbi:hypothetical protein [Arcanobacterium buesumense]|uniref:Beta-lactamase n=1 Tax=Arcanobacterium buesumense TaxID=2722751 RepID=A0A6H2EJI8_9ACTO|nr:hypothetical protein [Arcanobacterium buesumense]QJC21133.1 hypothetical protein HC352_00435 [Arcanobacterium buesumense]
MFPENISLSEPTLAELNAVLSNIEEKELSVGFVMIDIASGYGISYQPDAEFYGASTIKGPYVVAVNKFLPDEVNESDTALMHNAIDISDNDSYTGLRDRYGDDVFAIFADNVNVISSRHTTRLFTKHLIKSIEPTQNPVGLA